MDRYCSECGAVLHPLDEDEMGSAPRRFMCAECQMMFETHPAGGLVEVED